jgi:hypothetical protein
VTRYINKNTLQVISLQSSTQSEWTPATREEDTLSQYLGAGIDYNKLARQYEAAMHFTKGERCKKPCN